METEEVAKRVCGIEAEADPSLRTLRLAKFLGDLFGERGFRIIVTGGSAIELLTEGRYTSGDIDICFESSRPPLRLIAELMESIGATGGVRSFRKGRLFIDILGQVETLANTPFREIDGVLVAKPEDLIPERVLMAVYPRPDAFARLCAEKLVAAVLTGALPADWEEIRRVAALPEYRILDELDNLRAEVENQLGR